MSDPLPHERIQALRDDIVKLRTDQHNTAQRWLGDRWRYKHDMANDIEYLINLVTGAKGS